MRLYTQQPHSPQQSFHPSSSSICTGPFAVHLIPVLPSVSAHTFTPQRATRIRCRRYCNWPWYAIFHGALHKTCPTLNTTAAAVDSAAGVQEKASGARLHHGGGCVGCPSPPICFPEQELHQTCELPMWHTGYQYGCGTILLLLKASTSFDSKTTEMVMCFESMIQQYIQQSLQQTASYFLCIMVGVM